MDLRKVWKLLRGRRAVSAVVSNVILTGAVITVGFVVLAWAQSQKIAYQGQYSGAMNVDVARLKERLAFEYIYYNNSAQNLSIYLLNSGIMNSTSIQTVFVSNSTWFISNSSISSLTLLKGGSAASLNIGQEGYFVLTGVNLVTGNSYSVEIITGRGSIFESTFVA
jgi:hypothetical protein